jgi:acetolactate synthase-1/2/3 large subunit
VTDFTALCAALKSSGIRHTFGVPGTQSLCLFDALGRSELRFTLTAHELGAAFMANGYFRASGSPAAVLTIGGPGFTNALTGIAEARLDSVPLVHLVNAPAAAPGERFQLQAIDQAGIAGPLVKGRFRISGGVDVPDLIREAVHCAVSGEPGPVLVEYDTGRSGAPASELGRTGQLLTPDSAATYADVPIREEDDPQFEELAARWIAARRPILLLGQGCASEFVRVRRLAESVRIPVLTTPSARGLLPEDHPLAMGFDVLRGGLDVVNGLLDASDLVIAAGCKLGHNGSAGFRLRLPPDRLVRVDPSREVLQANFPAAVRLLADAAALFSLLEAHTGHRQAQSEWTDQELVEARAGIRRPSTPVVDPAVVGPGIRLASEFFLWLRQALPRESILVTDSGLHQILARRHFDVLSERGLVLPSDFQSMGFGIPAGIGARFAAPGRPVVVLVGDGGFLMSGLEIATAVRERLPLLFIVFNDGFLNQIRLQQLGDSGRPFGVETAELDHERFASAVGAEYLALERLQGPADLARLLHRDGPAILEVRVGDSWPMRSKAAGARLKAAARAVRDATPPGRRGKRSG